MCALEFCVTLSSSKGKFKPNRYPARKTALKQALVNVPEPNLEIRKNQWMHFVGPHQGQKRSHIRAREL